MNVVWSSYSMLCECLYYVSVLKRSSEKRKAGDYLYPKQIYMHEYKYETLLQRSVTRGAIKPRYAYQCFSNKSLRLHLARKYYLFLDLTSNRKFMQIVNTTQKATSF